MKGNDFLNIIIGLAIVYLLFKMFGESQDERKAKKLRTKTPEAEPNKAGELVKAVIKKATKAQIEKIKANYKKKDFTAIAQQIFEAKGTLNDNEQAVYGALNMLDNKVELNILADTFQRQYKYNLVSYLVGFMSDTELAKVYDIIKALPLK